MNRLPVVLLVLVLLGFAVPATALTPAHLWSKKFGDASPQQGYAVATDAAGNVYVAGSFSGTVNFGGSSLVSSGSQDIFLAKFDLLGAHQWSKKFGDTFSQYGRSLALDPSGNVILAGDFSGTVNFGSGNRVSSGGLDIYVAKFSPSGAALWSSRFGDSLDQNGRSVATDASGNVFLAGYFFGAVNFGGGSLSSTGGTNVFLAKFNPTGAHQWSSQFGDFGTQTASSIATDAAGNVFLTGDFQGTINFGGGDLTSVGSDMFLAKFDSAGINQWSQRFGTASDSESFDVATDPLGNVLMTGRFLGLINFGGDLLIEQGGGIGDIFVAKFDATGAHQWSMRFGDGYEGIGAAAATDAEGNVYLTGYARGLVNFGGATFDTQLLAGVYLLKLSSAGAHALSQVFPGTSDQFGEAVATSVSDVYLAGHFYGTINFAAGALVSAGSEDILLARFGQLSAEPVISSISDVGNDQGRQVWINFSRSGSDANVTPFPVDRYDVFRRQDAGAEAAHEAREDPLALIEWVFVGSVPAHGESGYLAIAPTVADSTIAEGQHYSVFFIRAGTANPQLFFDSPPDSGYSIDNLAPGVPTNFTYVAGTLSWDPSTANDFDHFTVYGSNSDCFCAATAIDYTVTPTMDVSGSPYAYYFVTATDVSGNEGNPAVMNTLTGVGGTPTSYALTISSYPNPFNPETTIRYTVPSTGHVNVSVYDARGAHVATLVNESRTAGAHTHEWTGRDGTGNRASSGVYFARVTHASGTRSYKLVLLK